MKKTDLLFAAVFMLSLMSVSCDDGDSGDPNQCSVSTPCTNACAKMVSCGAFDSVEECQDAYPTQRTVKHLVMSWCEFYISPSQCSEDGGFAFHGDNCKAISDCDDFLSCM